MHEARKPIQDVAEMTSALSTETAPVSLKKIIIKLSAVSDPEEQTMNTGTLGAVKTILNKAYMIVCYRATGVEG